MVDKVRRLTTCAGKFGLKLLAKNHGGGQALKPWGVIGKCRTFWSPIVQVRVDRDVIIPLILEKMTRFLLQ
jgi:hypothetical protein